MRPLPEPSAERQRALLERLRTLPERFGPAGPATPLLDELLDTAILATGAERGNVQVVTRLGDLEIATQRGFEREFLDFFARVGQDGSACAAAYRYRQCVSVADVATDPLFDERARQVMLRAEARAVQSTPVTTATGTLVAMVSTHLSEPGRFSTRALELVAEFARAAGPLLERRGVTGRVSEVPFLVDLLHARLRAGLLPRARPQRMWGGRGQGIACSACRLPITPRESEYEMDVNGRTYRFHVGCYRLWNIARRAPLG